MKKITCVVIAVTIITVILFVMRVVEIGKPLVEKTRITELKELDSCSKWAFRVRKCSRSDGRTLYAIEFNSYEGHPEMMWMTFGPGMIFLTPESAESQLLKLLTYDSDYGTHQYVGVLK